MAKRKITVTVDEELVESIRAFERDSLSALVNAALAAEVARRERMRALDRLLAEWDEAYGPVPDIELDAAERAFDELDAVSAFAK